VIASLSANSERIARRLAALEQFTESERPYTRRAFTPLYSEARAWLAQKMESGGLSVMVDAGANLIGTRAGQGDTRGALMMGSHIDTVPGGGRFDGIAGVIAALEVAEVLQENNVLLRHPLKVVDFLSEEPSDYGASCVGSRALAGTLTQSMLASTNPGGETLADAVKRMGGEPQTLTAPLMQTGDIAGFLELHIEQGPVLETAKTSIGIVEGIVAIDRYRLTVSGRAAHAGTTPMSLRDDALVVTLVNKKARAWSQDEHFVATIGRFNVFPNGANVVPGRVKMIVEARALTDAQVQQFFGELRDELARTIPAEKFSFEKMSEAAAVQSDPRIVAALKYACDRSGYTFQQMASGAGHDAMQVANIAPVGMIFIPCRAGVSHHPDEYAEIADITAGANVLLQAALKLDGEWS
jgi:N-carbamoyl-L-amino-acid hydrolase